MKSTFRIIALILIISISTNLSPQEASAQASASFKVFYDNLGPYGYWVNNPDYGYVWVPNVSPGFIPYSTNGYWVFTDEGWTWVSNYSWGWATFHYGRWFYDANYGWMWAPDNEWGPGWVIWRRSAGYYGWAPLGPGISLDIANSPRYSVPYNHWKFVSNRYFGKRDINKYYIKSSNNRAILKTSVVVNNLREDKKDHIRYNAGPDRKEVETRAGKKFTPIHIQESDRPGENLGKDHLQLYKPQVQKNITIERRPAPSKVVTLKDIKPSRERKTKHQQPPLQKPNKKKPVRHEPTKQPPKKQNTVKKQPTRQPSTKQIPKKGASTNRQQLESGKKDVSNKDKR